MNKQQAKESACLEAIRQGHGLIRRGSETHAIFRSGESKVISRSNNVDLIWHDALTALQSQRKNQAQRINPYDSPTR